MRKKLITLVLVGILTIPSSCFADSKKIMLDPGHGGNDSGAISYNGKYKEKDLNLKTSLSCKKELEEHNVEVKMTREKDVYLTLKERVDMSNEYKPDIFVSIHHNASSNKEVNRGEVIYQVKEGESQRLAECLKEKLKDIGNLEVKIYNRYNAKGSDYYGVLRGNKAPSVIVEVSFITSEKGLSLVDTDEELQKNGELIAEGLLDFFDISYDEEKKTNVVRKDVKKDKKTEIKKVSKKESALDKLFRIADKKNNNKGLNKLYEILDRKNSAKN